jgi:hypothetical protein
MYVHFDLPSAPSLSQAFDSYWLHSLFIRSASTRFEINALTSTYFRLVSAAVVEYDEGSKRLREFWSSNRAVNLGAMHRSTSHFESCIFNMNRAINCYRRLRGDKLHDPIAVALRQEKVSFARDVVAGQIREMRNEIHHLEDSLLSGKIEEGQNTVLRADGPETPHPSEENQTNKTIDRLVVSSHEILFRDLVQWLTEMIGVVEHIVAALSCTPPQAPMPNAT